MKANHYSLCTQTNLCDLPKEKKGEGKCVKKLGHLERPKWVAWEVFSFVWTNIFQSIDHIFPAHHICHTHTADNVGGEISDLIRMYNSLCSEINCYPPEE